ncbi:MAG: hypothetical protein PHH43_06600 [Candidatus Cloacimonetes bacterium]|jgi:hypothetical protein|nr:hypothetical protein [Candidatus Cloacimonadota bacterium]MDD3235981.1 hypothetical protein [Candidatus Cloacimonadota bacterium]
MSSDIRYQLPPIALMMGNDRAMIGKCVQFMLRKTIKSQSNLQFGSLILANGTKLPFFECAGVTFSSLIFANGQIKQIIWVTTSANWLTENFNWLTENFKERSLKTSNGYLSQLRSISGST